MDRFACRLSNGSRWVNSIKNNFDPQLETKGEEESHAAYCSQNPGSPQQADATLRQPVTTTEPWTAIDDRLNKSLTFDPNVFVPSSTPTAVVKTQELKPVLSSKFLVLLTPTTLSSISVPMKLRKMDLDTLCGDPLEWPEWFEQFLAIVDQSGSTDIITMNYLKTLLSGKAKAAIEGTGCSGQMYHLAWQTLEHDFGRPELVVNAQLHKIQAYSFIKLYNLLKILKLLLDVCDRVFLLTHFGYDMDTGSDSVLNGTVRKLPIELKNKWLTYLLKDDASYKKCPQCMAQDHCISTREFALAVRFCKLQS